MKNKEVQYSDGDDTQFHNIIKYVRILTRHSFYFLLLFLNSMLLETPPITLLLLISFVCYFYFCFFLVKCTPFSFLPFISSRSFLLRFSFFFFMAPMFFISLLLLSLLHLLSPLPLPLLLLHHLLYHFFAMSIYFLNP
jgi:hypothetical protein